MHDDVGNLAHERRAVIFLNEMQHQVAGGGGASTGHDVAIDGEKLLCGEDVGEFFLKSREV